MLVDIENPILRDNSELKSNCIVPMKSAKMHLPASIGDYTDFYSSIHHATNVGIMFRSLKNLIQQKQIRLPPCPNLIYNNS